ncbi:hypothetical protein PACTADRAFT_28762, partial [Pachysolen tannophilus NRRL Y-2460]
PIITTTLSHSFPYLLVLDNILSFITWTNDDPYYNFLCMTAIVLVIVKWEFFSIYLLPLLIVFIFSCITWSVQSILIETKNQDFQNNNNNNNNNDYDDVPTIEEILYTLSNISTRFEILVSSAHFLKNYTKADLIRVIFLILLLTPLYWLLLYYAISLKSMVILITVFCLTFHSDWAIATRSLLWRSIYTRKIICLLSGLDINLYTSQQNHYDLQSKKSQDINNFEKKLDFKIISIEKNSKIVEFEILENQRRWIGIGWSTYLFPYDRANFTSENLISCKSPTTFEFPQSPDPSTIIYTWKWLQPNWMVDRNFSRTKVGDGWLYYDNYWKYPSPEDSITKYTRTRRWKRRAILTIDEK